MEMNYILMKKKNDKRIVEVPILEILVKQPKSPKMNPRK
jgi:hypothetical protein